MRPFGEDQNKATRAYAQSGQYHTIVESRVPLTLMCTLFASKVRGDIIVDNNKQ